MPRSGIAAPRGEAGYDAERSSEPAVSPDVQQGRGAGVPGRRTVTITGQGAEGYASRNGTRPSAAARHRQLKRHERSGFRPDRVAMWAVLLGVVLMLAAATSGHAAVIASPTAILGAHPAAGVVAHRASALAAALAGLL
jgi:hypothetical protein